ncbi:MAG: TIM barrel protein [Chloroflexota bacterium]
MNGLIFGTGGIPLSSSERSTVSGIERIRELGLGCMEIEFVRGITMSEATARLVAKAAARNGVVLSVHAPYFINLNAREVQKVNASQKRLIRSAQIGALCGATSIVFHAAFYLGDPPELTFNTVTERLAEVITQLKAEDCPVCLRPEITGKPTQFGTIEEIAALSLKLPEIAPCIDLAHWHARTGDGNSYEELARILEFLKAKLGQEALGKMHIHFSGIAYSKKGEQKHLPLQESDLHYTELLRALKDYHAKGLVICESPNLEEDALLLKEIYEALPEKQSGLTK